MQEKQEEKIKEPTVKEMQDFAKRFTEKEWKELCKWNDFYKYFDKDIKKTKVIAEQILAGKYNGSTR